MAELRSTVVDAYVEADGTASLRSTVVDAYVEARGLASLRATTVGSYTEVDGVASLRATSLGAYVEIGEAVPVVSAVTITLAGIDITNYINMRQLAGIVRQLAGIVRQFKTTVLSSSGETWLPTAGAWAIPMGGKWSIESDTIIASLALHGGLMAFEIGFRTVTYSWAEALFADYTVTSSSPRDGIVWLASVAGVGVPIRITS